MLPERPVVVPPSVMACTIYLYLSSIYDLSVVEHAHRSWRRTLSSSRTPCIAAARQANTIPQFPKQQDATVHHRPAHPPHPRGSPPAHLTPNHPEGLLDTLSKSEGDIVQPKDCFSQPHALLAHLEAAIGSKEFPGSKHGLARDPLDKYIKAMTEC